LASEGACVLPASRPTLKITRHDIAQAKDGSQRTVTRTTQIDNLRFSNEDLVFQVTLDRSQFGKVNTSVSGARPKVRTLNLDPLQIDLVNCTFNGHP
jgi:hypothetical protein